MFFAVLADLEQILKGIESNHSLQYFETGLFDTSDVKHYKSIFELPDLGFTSYGDWNYDRSLLVMPDQSSLQIREVPQKKGGIKYAVDLFSNPVSISLQLGGIYKGKGNVLVAGKIGIVSNNKEALELYKYFSSSIKKAFRKINEFYVGRVAEEKLKSGWRLVLDEGRQKEYDLVMR